MKWSALALIFHTFEPPVWKNRYWLLAVLGGIESLLLNSHSWMEKSIYEGIIIIFSVLYWSANGLKMNMPSSSFQFCVSILSKLSMLIFNLVPSLIVIFNILNSKGFIMTEEVKLVNGNQAFSAYYILFCDMLALGSNYFLVLRSLPQINDNSSGDLLIIYEYVIPIHSTEEFRLLFDLRKDYCIYGPFSSRPPWHSTWHEICSFIMVYYLMTLSSVLGTIVTHCSIVWVGSFHIFNITRDFEKKCTNYTIIGK